MRRLDCVMRQLAMTLTLAMLLGGCHAGETDRTGAAAVRIHEQAGGKVHIAWSNAHADDGEFVVTGVLRRDDTIGAPIDVIVQASVVAADGHVLDQAQSGDIRVPRRIVNRVQSFERFEVHFPAAPPEGASIQIVARSNPPL